MIAALRRHPYLTAAFALASTLALWLLVHVVAGLIYWQAHEDEPIEPWMTVGYIGRSWDLSPRAIDEAAGLPPPEDGRPFTLAEIARRRGVPVEVVIAEVEAALAELRSRDRPPEWRAGDGPHSNGPGRE